MNSTCTINVDAARASAESAGTASAVTTSPLIMAATTADQATTSATLQISTISSSHPQQKQSAVNSGNNRTTCMFETNQQNHHHTRFAVSSTAYGFPEKQAFSSWGAAQQHQQLSNGSSTSTSSSQSTSSGGGVNNAIERASSAADLTSVGSSSSAPLYWSYPAAMIFVPESYYPTYNNNATGSNNLLVPNCNSGAKYWTAAPQSEVYRTMEPQNNNTSNKTLSSSVAITTSSTSSTTPTVVDLQYDHEPTYANLTPIRRAATAAITATTTINNNDGNSGTTAIETQQSAVPTSRADYRGYNFDNTSSTFNNNNNNVSSSYQFHVNSNNHQLLSASVNRTGYANQTLGSLYTGSNNGIMTAANGYNVRKTTDGIVYQTTGFTSGTSAFETATSTTSDGGTSAIPWYGGALQSSLSTPTLLTLSHLASTRNGSTNHLLPTSKPLSPMSNNNLSQQSHLHLNGGSSWSIHSISNNKSTLEQTANNTNNNYLSSQISNSHNKTPFQQTQFSQQYDQTNGSGGVSSIKRPTAVISTITASLQQNNNNNNNSTNNGGNKKLFICYICSKAYARPSTLRMHMRIHSGVRPYHCRICNKSFCQTANLSAHLRTHNGDKPFACPMCQRKFSQSSSVKTHMRVHTGQRPYKCQACSKTFSDSSTLAKHRRTHNGDRPYMCSVCYLRFTQSGNLNRHMRIHRSAPTTTISSSAVHKETAAT